MFSVQTTCRTCLTLGAYERSGIAPRTLRVRSDIRIEGFTPAEILAIPDEQLDRLVFTNTPVVFRVGTAEVLGQFAIRDTRLIAELAHIDGGGGKESCRR
jgi:hypothetical protein